MLAAEAAVLGTFSTAEPALLAAFWLLFAAMVPPQRRVGAVAHGSQRAVAAYMALSVVLFVGGVTLGYVANASPALERTGTVLMVAAVVTRKGIMPLHSWMIGFFERAALPEAILFSAPQIGAYAAARLIVPHAPEAVLTFISIASLVTAVYGAGLALVQTDAHRAFGAFFMSQSALVMTGLHSQTSIGVAGGLSLWISSGLALAGFGMTLAALEARRGALSLDRYSGGYDRTPFLATSFLLLGLAAVGFPGTLGFVGEEALVEGVVEEHPLVGIAVLITSALNGLLVLRTFFLLFGGIRVGPRAHQETRLRERAGFLTLVGFLVLVGLGPQFFLASRHRAAEAIIHERLESEREDSTGSGSAERAGPANAGKPAATGRAESWSSCSVT
jgi:NADH-quinone oxidoreductase subunit M